MPTQMNLPILVAEAVEAELARNPDKYRSITPGPKGDSLTLVSVVTEADFSLTMTFSDGTVYHSPPVRGIQGEEGVQGVRGPRGVGIHHTRWTATTNPEHHFGVAGHMDTYTLYGDEDESVILGWFSVKNGADGKDPYDFAVEGGYEGTKEEFYDAIAENASNFEEIRDLIVQSEELFRQVENKGQEFVDEINQIIADFMALKGAPNGFAELDENGTVPVEQIPVEVFGLIRVNTHAELPLTGVPRQLYLVVQDETAERASTLYHWTGFEYRTVSSQTSVLSIKALQAVVQALEENKASQTSFDVLSARVQAIEDTEAVVQVAHKSELPAVGITGVLYVIVRDESDDYDTTAYCWNGTEYLKLFSKTVAAILTALGKLRDDVEQNVIDATSQIQQLAQNVGNTYATQEDFDALVQERVENHETRIGQMETFKQIEVLPLNSHLPPVGNKGTLYVIEHDETQGGKVIAYFWNGYRYLSLNVCISADSGNALTMKNDGLYVPVSSSTWTQKVW